MLPLTRRSALALGLGLAAGVRAAVPSVPDAPLWHRDGRQVRLRSDVWRDRVALVNFVYTSCSSFCGVQSAMLAELQSRLGERMGREVVLISMSIDPLTDDPPRLQSFAQTYQPGPHWWWLTGEPRTMFRTLEALGADRGDPRDHAPLWLTGVAHSPRRLVGLPSLKHLEAALATPAGSTR